MISIYNDSLIYIMCPANLSTGGPELLHQLYFKLKLYGFNSFMYYVPGNISNPVNVEYEIYEVRYTNNIADNEKNILIFPEGYKYFEESKKFSRIRKIVWFLSVNNYYISRLKEKDLLTKVKNNLNTIIFYFTGYDYFDLNNLSKRHYNKINIKRDLIISDACLIMTNSYRGLYFLRNSLNRDIVYLSEYINKEFLKSEINIKNKKDIVLYNPKKGFKFTKKLIKFSKNINFVPIIGLSRKQVIELLGSAKVYIDFGPHPGKDRLPREAAILYCCVITSKRGSAAYFEDVPIPEQYKIEDKNENIKQIIELIKDCLENYEKHIINFEYYRNAIKKEEEIFEDSIRNIFKKNN